MSVNANTLYYFIELSKNNVIVTECRTDSLDGLIHRIRQVDEGNSFRAYEMTELAKHNV